MKAPVTFEEVRIYLSVNPWIRLLLPFASGIAMALCIAPEKNFYYLEMYGLLFFLMLAYLLAMYNKNGLGLKKWIPGIIGLLFLFCAGFQLARAGMSIRSPQHFSKHRWRLLYIQVNSVPENRGKRIRFQALALFGDKSAGKLSPGHAGTPLWVKTKGQLLVYLQPSTQHRVVYGDRLLILPVFREVSPPQNPAEFDYRRYLAGKDIYHQAFLSLKQWHYTGEHAGNPLIGGAADMQQRCVNLFHEAFEREEDAAMLSAFVLGYRSGINPATEAAFADTGTIHILSVSGLHVAILYWLVCLLLKPLDRLSAGKLLQLILGTGIIVMYVFVTGLSPPVCRAAWMIGIYQLARYLGREHQTGNALALTAFLLLASNPLVLADVGFQLSFLAAAGLAGCAPLISRHPEAHGPENHGFMARTGRWLLQQIRSMTTVSLAAQLITFPLAVYYFHQFPVYFLPANLLLIPLASLILYGGILLLPLSATGPPAVLLVAVLEKLIDIMNLLMQFFSRLPGAVLGGIWIHPAECAGLYLLIGCMIIFFLSRNGNWLRAALVILVILVAASAIESYRQDRQRRLIYFHTTQTRAVGFLAGREAVLFHEKPPDITHAAKGGPYYYSMRPFLQRSGIRRVEHHGLDENFRNRFLIKKGAWIQFFDQRLLMLDRHFSYPAMESSRGWCDLLLVTENTYLETEKLRQLVRIRMVVTGAEISAKLTDFLENDCGKTGTGFYSVKRSGAFLLSLNNPGR